MIVEIGKRVFLWKNVDFMDHLIQWDRDGTTVNIFKQAVVVASLFCEVADKESLVKSPLVTIINKVCFNRAVKKVKESWKVLLCYKDFICKRGGQETL